MLPCAAQGRRLSQRSSTPALQSPLPPLGPGSARGRRRPQPASAALLLLLPMPQPPRHRDSRPASPGHPAEQLRCCLGRLPKPPAGRRAQAARQLKAGRGSPQLPGGGAPGSGQRLVGAQRWLRLLPAGSVRRCSLLRRGSAAAVPATGQRRRLPSAAGRATGRHRRWRCRYSRCGSSKRARRTGCRCSPRCRQATSAPRWRAAQALPAMQRGRDLPRAVQAARAAAAVRPRLPQQRPQRPPAHAWHPPKPGRSSRRQSMHQPALSPCPLPPAPMAVLLLRPAPLHRPPSQERRRPCCLGWPCAAARPRPRRWG